MPELNLNEQNLSLLSLKIFVNLLILEQSSFYDSR